VSGEREGVEHKKSRKRRVFGPRLSERKTRTEIGGRFKVDDPALIRTWVKEWRIQDVGGPQNPGAKF